MQDFEYVSSTRFVFGRGAEKQIGRLIGELRCSKVMIVYGENSTLQSGLLEKIKNAFDAKGIGYVLLGGVKYNAQANLVYEGIALGRKEGVDFLLAIGGGGAIDTAKAIAVGIPSDGDFFDFFLGARNPLSALGIGSILTVPASGSEASASSAVEKKTEGKIIKRIFSSPMIIPRFAVMNPEFSLTLPPYQTACGITDMLVHILEKYFTNTKNVSVSDRILEGLLKAIIENASLVLKDPFDYEARANIMWAGTIVNNNLCSAGREQDWASHKLEYHISGLYDVAHGAGLAVIVPAWMEHVFKHDVMRFAQFACRVFGCAMDFEYPDHTARDGIKALRGFLKSIGMPLYFEDIGLSDRNIPQLLSLLDVDDEEKSIGHFMILHRKDCEQIYYIAARYGKK